MNAWVDHELETQGQARPGLSRSTSDPGTQASVVIFDTDSREPRVIGYRSDNAQALCTVPDRSLEARVRNERPRPSKKIASRESGLARSVGTGNQGQPEIQLELRLVRYSGNRRPEGTEGSTPFHQSRIGMTTYLQAAVPGPRIRQLLFESVSPSSTSPASTAPSASRR